MTYSLFLLLIALHPLTETISKATKASPEYQAEREKYEGIKKRTSAVAFRFSPTVNAKGANTWSATGRSDLTRALSVTGELQWNLFRFGSDYQLLSAAHDEEQAALAELKTQELIIEETIATALFEALLNQRRNEVTDKLLETREKIYAISRKRFQNGRLAEEDLKSAEIDLKNAEAESLQTKADMHRSVVALERWKISVDQAALWPQELIESWALKWPADKVALEALPKVGAKSSQYRRLQNLASSEWRKLAPSIDSSLLGGWSRAGGDSWTKAWEGSLSLNIPIFDQWKSASTASGLERDAAAARFEVEALLRQAKAEVTSNYESLKIYLQLMQGRKDILKASSQTYQMKIRRFESGRLSVNELSLELTRLLQSELLTRRSERDLALAYTKFMHSIGKSLSENN